MDSGPCDGLHGVGCLRAISREYVERETDLRIMDDMPNGVTVAGELEDVVKISHEDWERENQVSKEPSPSPVARSRLVYACWGDGTWSRSQLIGEIARGGWGMTIFKSSDAFQVEGHPDPPGPEGLFMKLHRENRPIAPEENEMSRAFEEPLEARPFRDTDEAREHRERLRAQLLVNNPMDISTCENKEDEARLQNGEVNTTNDVAIEMSEEEKCDPAKEAGPEDLSRDLL